MCADIAVGIHATTHTRHARPQHTMHVQSIVAPRVLLPVVDSDAKTQAFTSINSKVPHLCPEDDTDEDKYEEREDSLEESSVCKLCMCIMRGMLEHVMLFCVHCDHWMIAVTTQRVNPWTTRGYTRLRKQLIVRPRMNWLRTNHLLKKNPCNQTTFAASNFSSCLILVQRYDHRMDFMYILWTIPKKD